jgi:hypothetical protein
MKYEVHCQGFDGQFSIICDAETPTEAKDNVKKQNPNVKILQVTMNVNLK